MDDDGSTLIRPKRQEERRGAFRLPVEIDVCVEGGAHHFEAVTGDLSPGGMFIATPSTEWLDSPIPVGTDVMITFGLREGGGIPLELAVIGVVQWRRDDHDDGAPGLGIAFFCLDPQVRASLVRFCAVREPLYSLRADDEENEYEVAQSA